jgi:L-arabinose isomerase
MNAPLAPAKIWFLTGAQHLYGPGPLRAVADHARKIAAALDRSQRLPLEVVNQPLLTTPEQIKALCLAADSDPECAGLILWMHTFSPARMWIGGLSGLRKPFVHLHTQFNRDLPWERIDMDFMNLNQSAHGDREAGSLHARLRLRRKIVVGHWQDPEVHARLSAWMRAARAWHDAQGARFARFGDNMRQVSVTEGDKVAAETVLGYSVNGYGVGDLAAAVAAVPAAAVAGLCTEYEERYAVARPLRRGGPRHASLREGARIELGLRAFLRQGGCKGFTTTFEDLHGLQQLPGLAVQRLMADGYGFGGEGDWKTCALVRAMKVMADGLPGGTSFMEDYTYDLGPRRPLVLGAHMLELCESIAAGKPRLEVHPLGIGGKDDPVRLVFNAPAGPALNASLVDLGGRFRLIANQVDVVRPPRPLPRLPVARAVWTCRPDFKTAGGAWIRAGGSHHTGFSYAVTPEHLRDFAEIAGLEFLLIDERTTLLDFEREMRTNEVYYHLAAGFRG